MNSKTLWVDPDQMISLEESIETGQVFLDVVVGKEMYVKRLWLSAEESQLLKGDRGAAKALAEAVRKGDPVYQYRIEEKA